MTSANGTTWTVRTSPSNVWNSVAWSPSLGLFAAVGLSGVGTQEVMTSPDGITWTLHSTPSNSFWVGITWGATAPNGLGG